MTVTVIEKMVWTKGNPLYGAIHLNRTYLFPNAELQAKFLANPDRYSPIISGNDPVVALEKSEIVPGRRQFGLVYENRMILFSSKESYDKFCKESKRYTTELQQALQSSNAIRRYSALGGRTRGDCRRRNATERGCARSDSVAG